MPCLGRLSARVCEKKKETGKGLTHARQRERERGRATHTQGGRARITRSVALRVRVEESYGEQGRGADVLQGTGENPWYFAWPDGQLLEGKTGSLLMETGQRRTESELPPLCDGEGGYMLTRVCYISDMRAARFSNAIGQSRRQGHCSHRINDPDCRA